MDDQASIHTTTPGDVCPCCSFEARQKADQTPTTFDGISRHYHIWSQNATVDPEDRAIIRQDLNTTEHLIWAYNEDLSNVGAFLFKMDTTREFLLRSISQYRSLLHPIRNLPDSILLQMFRHVCDSKSPSNRQDSDEDFNLTIPNSSKALPPATIIPQVCRRWRTLAASPTQACPSDLDPPLSDLHCSPPNLIHHEQLHGDQQVLIDMQQPGDPNCPCCSFAVRQKVDIAPKAFGEAIRRAWLQNAPVDPEDMTALRRDLDTLERLVSALDEDVMNVRSVWFRVLVTRNALVRCVPRYQSLLHPIRCLPDDILLEIFRCTLYEPPIPTCDWFSDEDDAPIIQDSLHRCAPHWNISQVCCRWRTLALSCSGLWSSVYISIPNTRDLPWLEKRLTLLLQRSKSRDLDIWFVDDTDKSEGTPAADLFFLLKAHSGRWRTLYFQAASSLLKDMVEGSIGRIVAVRLCMLPSAYYTLPRHSPKILVFRSAPHLRIVYNTLPELEDFPWAQLSHFYGDLKAGLDMQCMQNIFNLRLDFGVMAASTLFTKTPFCTLPLLERLELSEGCAWNTSGGAGCIKEFLEHVRIPRLHTLKMSFARNTNSSIALPQFLPGSPLLVHLDIIRFYRANELVADTRDMLRFLRMVNSLETLTMRRHSMTVALLRGLRDGEYLPFLRKIAIEGEHLLSSFDLIYEVVQPRMGVLKELQILRGTYALWDIHPVWLDTAKLEQLESLGLVVNIP